MPVPEAHAPGHPQRADDRPAPPLRQPRPPARGARRAAPHARRPHRPRAALPHREPRRAERGLPLPAAGPQGPGLLSRAGACRSPTARAPAA
jgi:hypothetical protein